MTNLMMSHSLAFFLTKYAISLFQAGNHPFHGFLEVPMFSSLSIPSNGQEGSFIHHIS